MQNVLSTTAAKVNDLQAVTLYLALYGMSPYGVDVVRCRYSARASGGDEFSVGNACASSISVTVDSSARLGIRGLLIQLLWSVGGGDMYPLFTGYVTKERMEGGALVIEASDAIYTLGGTKAIPTGEETTAADCLATIADQMSLVVESATQTLAENLPLTLDNLPEKATCAQALALISRCLGGNAVITRDGLLAVRQFSIVDFSAETYDGGDTTEADGFAPTGLTFIRKVDEEDGTTTELRYEAGDGALELENELTDQTCADFAWAALDGLSFVPGTFTIPGGLLLECGDVFTVNGYAVACMDLSMDIDGGVKTTVTAYGSETKGGATGSLNQRVESALEGVNKVQQQVAQEKKDRKQSVEELNAALAGASGLYETIVEQEDGTSVQYLHDKATLEASSLVIVVNAGGIGISNDGGETYQYGFTFDGNAILNELHAEGIYGVKIFGEEGSIAGLDMIDKTLTATYTKTYPEFTEEDITKARNYIMGTVELTAEELETYDVNMDGRITSLDLLAMQKMIEGISENYSVYKFTIDASNHNACITVEVTEGYHAGWKTTIGMGSVSARNIIATSSLNVEGDLVLDGSYVDDFVVEVGESDFWRYQRWHSGKAECWGKKTYDSVDITAAWGSLFESAAPISETFPEDLFIDVPDTMDISFLTSDSGAGFIERGPYEDTVLSATSTGPFWICRGTALSGMANATIGFHAVGRWK